MEQQLFDQDQLMVEIREAWENTTEEERAIFRGNALKVLEYVARMNILFREDDSEIEGEEEEEEVSDDEDWEQELMEHELMEHELWSDMDLSDIELESDTDSGYDSV